jgi:hypothetical protein
MLDLTCYVGLLRPHLQLPFPLKIGNRTIGEHFALGSRNKIGSPGINMHVDESSRLNSSLIPSDRPTSAYYLQNALYRLVSNSPHNRDIHRIGLIIADRYKSRSGLLGLMFDWGFVPSGEEPLDSRYLSVPREGCAIFLNAIKDIRPIINAYEKEVVFTAIHELGHVFNLWHINDIKNFMSTSDQYDVYSPGAYNFRPEQRSLLHQAETNSKIRPGGSRFDGNSFNAPTPKNPFKEATTDSQLKLDITIEQLEFWYFEPIELGIRLSLRAGKATSIDVPDEVDPGYDQFKIYITRPDGTVFKYRSPRIYCQNPAIISLSVDKSFQRDVSIFGQSGGYTFRIPGLYQIQCFWELPGDILLASNRLEVLVRKPQLKRLSFDKLKRLLTTPEVALFLYHRSGYFSQATLETLDAQSRKDKKNNISANISYAIARYTLHTTGQLNRTELSLAAHHLNKGLDSGLLSSNRVKNLVEVKDTFNL